MHIVAAAACTAQSAEPQCNRRTASNCGAQQTLTASRSTPKRTQVSSHQPPRRPALQHRSARSLPAPPARNHCIRRARRRARAPPPARMRRLHSLLRIVALVHAAQAVVALAAADAREKSAATCECRCCWRISSGRAQCRDSARTFELPPPQQCESTAWRLRFPSAAAPSAAAPACSPALCVDKYPHMCSASNSFVHATCVQVGGVRSWLAIVFVFATVALVVFGVVCIDARGAQADAAHAGGYQRAAVPSREDVNDACQPLLVPLVAHPDSSSGSIQILHLSPRVSPTKDYNAISPVNPPKSPQQDSSSMK